MSAATLHDFHATSLIGTDIALSDFSGKVLLVANTASQCGLTPQYEGLEALYRTYEDRGFAVLGFPCNQFGGQEPGGSDEIATFCLRNYGVSFPMFAKIDVNGPGTHPVFRFLKQQAPGWLGQWVRWNFTKFLVDGDGKVLRRFAPATAPAKIAPYIEKALG